MHSEYTDYAHHFGLPGKERPTKEIIDEINARSSAVWDKFLERYTIPTPDEQNSGEGFIGIIPTIEKIRQYVQPYDSQPIITEDIDYEIVEPSQLPPSNTIDE